MNKKELTETDICTQFITPAIVAEVGAKWDVIRKAGPKMHCHA